MKASVNMLLFIYTQNIKSFHFLPYSIISHFCLISGPQVEAFVLLIVYMQHLARSTDLKWNGWQRTYKLTVTGLCPLSF